MTLADALYEADPKEEGISAVSIRAYKAGRVVPERSNLDKLCSVLFGDDLAHARAREELTRAWSVADRTRDQKVRDKRKAVIPRVLADPKRPIEPPRCFGRERELTGLVQALCGDATKYAILLGGGGIGKTTLAEKVASATALKERFGEHSWQVRLTAARSGSDLQSEIIRTLGYDAAKTDFGYVLKRLHARTPALLLLDNLETPWNEDVRGAREVLRQLADVQGLSLLATFRGHDKPDIPEWSLFHVGSLDESAALKMFLSYAPYLEGDALLRPFLAELYGIPLLIRNVALRANRHPALNELWEEWQRLGVGMADDPNAQEERHQSLSKSVAFSWQSSRLRESARRLFRLLGQLPAGISQQDRFALLGNDAAAAAEQLFAFGLAEWRSDSRLDLLPPIRDVARQEYSPDEANSMKWRVHYLELVAREGRLIRRAGGKRSVLRIAPEIPNIDAAIVALAEAGECEMIGEAAHAILTSFLFTGGSNPVGLRRATEGSKGNPAAFARCHIALAELAFFRSDLSAARSDLAAAIKIATDVADDGIAADCLSVLANVDGFQGKVQIARDGYGKALLLYEQQGDELGMAHCLVGIADLDSLQNNTEASRNGYGRASLLFEQHGDILGKAHCIYGIADLDREQGNMEAALIGYEAARLLYEQQGDNLGKAHCLRGIADIDGQQGNIKAARARYRQARVLFEEQGDDLGKAHCIYGIADLDSYQDKAETARKGYRQALMLYEQQGSDICKAQCLRSLADLDLLQGKVEVARGRYREAYLLFEQQGDDLGKADCFRGVAELDGADGRLEAARNGYRQAHQIYEQHGNDLGKAHCLCGLAELAESEGDEVEASRLYVEAKALYAVTKQGDLVDWIREKLDVLGLSDG